ncbi:MAG TPA: hypothetical protein VGG57_05685 [Stellaceae bacterium]|jgi:hypothetical protein
MHAYLPNLAALAAVAITWGIGGVLLLAGGMLGGGREPEFRIGAGWGGLCLVLTLWGVFVPASPRVAAVAFIVVALAALLIRRGRLPAGEGRTVLRVLALSLPLWLLMAPIRPSQPDTFLNLLPNAAYLVEYGRFPTAALPPSFSFLPAAPYDTQFLAFLGGLIQPGYPAAGMSLVNVMLFLVAGLAIARALGEPNSLSPQWAERELSLPWSLVGLGLLLAILLNPGFVPRIDFAGYGEPGLMVTALLAALLFTRRPAAPLAVGLILAAMINTKQSGIGLAVAAVGAAKIVFFLEEGYRLHWIRLITLASIPCAVLYAVWRYFVAGAGVDELTILPLAQWHWGLIPQILASELHEIAEKPVYFGLVLVAFVCWPVLQRRRGWTRTTRLLAFHASAFVLYNIFLILAYLGQFSAGMSAEAHSYFRYSTHLSLVLVAALALAARDLGLAAFALRRARLATMAVLALVLLGPIGFAKRLRFDLVQPQPLVWNLAAALKPHLKDGDRLALLLPGDNDSVRAMLEGVLRDVSPRLPHLDLLVRRSAAPETLDEAARLGYAKALISCTGDHAAALMAHDDAGWHKVASFPYPPEAYHQRWQSILAWQPLCR